MTARPSGDGGLCAAELSASVDQLRPLVVGMRIRDAARLADHDDLILFLDPEEDSSKRRCALQIAAGGTRGRICPTLRRFARREFATGPLVDRLARRLEDRTVADVTTPDPTERIVRFHFAGPDADPAETRPAKALVVELFGPRGLWLALDDGDRILEVSRIATQADRSIRPGDVYAPPPARPDRRAPSGRFPDDGLLAAIDAEFTARDRRAELQRLRDVLERTLTRRHKKAAAQRDGMLRQIESAQRAGELRRRAELLLAYGFTATVDATTTAIEVPDPDDPDGLVTIPFDPHKPVPVQANALFDKARRRAGAAVTARERIGGLEDELRRIDGFLTRVHDTSDDDARALVELGELFRELGDLDWIRRPPPTASAAPAKRAPKPKKGLAAENFRRFHSAEGFEILVGRDNRQNDRLSIRYARGNDLWFHVGRGQVGSHVVVRVAKGRNASLETLLDAATVAVHFSKWRGAELCEVIYTQAKNVRKPKGLPPGKVLATQTRELRVRIEPARLERVLGSADETSGS